MEAAELAQETVIETVEEKNPLEDFILFNLVDTFNDLDDEVSGIEAIETIQGFDKMYQFVNEDITYNALQEYADKCLQYTTPNFDDYARIEQRAAEIKSKTMIIEDNDLDYI